MIGISLKTAFSKYLPCAQWGSRISKWLRFPVGHIVSAIRAARGDKYGCTWVNVINTPECEAQTLSKRGGGSLLGCEWVCVYVWVHGRAKDCQEKQKSHCLWLPWSWKAFASTGITRDTSSFWKPDRLHGLQHNKGPAVHQTHFLLILAASANIMLVERKLFLLFCVCALDCEIFYNIKHVISICYMDMFTISELKAILFTCFVEA